MKQWLIKAVCAVVRIYYQYFPGEAGKIWIWRRILERYVLWRTMPLVARTTFGRFDGYLPDTIQSYLYFFGLWEPAVTHLYRLHLRPGDICIDIGANVGAHALLAASLVGSTGRVHAIEASPTIYARLQQNCASSSANIELYNLAVTDKDGPVTVFLDGADNLGGTTIMQHIASERITKKTETISGKPLASIVSTDQILSARLIKIDVEGAEWIVLQGMANVLPLLGDECLILVELAGWSLLHDGQSISSVVAWLAGFGFEPLEVRNSYLPSFYITPLRTVFDPTIRTNADLVDVAFARPMLRRRLLAQDTASS